jgi:hypothetical protein
MFINVYRDTRVRRSPLSLSDIFFRDAARDGESNKRYSYEHNPKGVDSHIPDCCLKY